MSFLDLFRRTLIARRAFHAHAFLSIRGTYWPEAACGYCVAPTPSSPPEIVNWVYHRRSHAALIVPASCVPKIGAIELGARSIGIGEIGAAEHGLREVSARGSTLRRMRGARRCPSFHEQRPEPAVAHIAVGAALRRRSADRRRADCRSADRPGRAGPRRNLRADRTRNRSRLRPRRAAVPRGAARGAGSKPLRSSCEPSRPCVSTQRACFRIYGQRLVEIWLKDDPSRCR